jgi:hypothetical protein
MNERNYGWKGWKLPILDFSDPDYCELGCPICTNARRVNKLAKFLQKIEIFITFGGCWWGRARKKKYGVKPNESVNF